MVRIKEDRHELSRVVGPVASSRLATRVIIFLIVVVAVGQLAAPIFLYASLGAAKDHVRSAARNLKRDDIDGALSDIEAAIRELESAERLTTAPSIRLLGKLGLGADVDAIVALTGASNLTLTSSRDFLSVVQDASPSDGLTGVLYRDNQVQFSSARTVLREIPSLEVALRASLDQLGELASPRLSAISKEITRLKHLLTSARDGVSRMRRILSALPALAGERSRTTLALALQSPSEARGGGGLIGVVGSITFRDGRPQLGTPHPIEVVNRKLRGPIDAPTWFRRTYSLLKPVQDPRQVNVSPSFASTSRLLLRMLKETQGVVYDGVVALDPIAFGKMAEAFGGISASGWDKEIGRSNARRLLLNEIYEHFRYREREQNLYLSRLVTAFWTKVTESPARGGTFLAAIANAARTMHLKAYSEVPAVQEAFAKLTVDGEPRTFGPSTQMFFSNNLGGNKSDFFVHRRISTTINLLSDGSARVGIIADLSNSPGPRAQARPRSRLINRSSVHFLMPKGSEPTSLAIDHRRLDPFVGRDRSFPVTYQVISLSPGEETVINQRYKWPDAWDPATGEFKISLVPQATVWPDEFKISVRAPTGYRISSNDVTGDLEWRRPSDSLSVLTGKMKEPRLIRIALLSP